jgi:hypothetical protein
MSRKLNAKPQRRKKMPQPARACGFEEREFMTSYPFNRRESKPECRPDVKDAILHVLFNISVPVQTICGELAPPEKRHVGQFSSAMLAVAAMVSPPHTLSPRVLDDTTGASRS